LIGPRYALLRPEFAALREQSLSRRKNPELKRILISLGGVDRTNVTGQILTALAHSSLPTSTELDIIMGAAAPYLDEVRQQAARLPFKAMVSVNVKDMAERMRLADMSIGAVGSTSWERCCLGLPAILVVLAENQKSAAAALKKSGAVIITDSGEGVRAELEQLMKVDFGMSRLIKMVNLGAAMVDGNGCLNVVGELTARSHEF
jgi:spore coat polysaccharide biosynthesis predicted glycosyltransferase SpsG